MDIVKAVEFARSHHKSVLTTIRKDTRPQLSNVTHWVGDDGLIRISITADRAKYFNLSREPWTALHISSEDFWSYAVIEGTAELSPVAADPGDATVEELIAYYRAVSGEHPDWDDYRRAMVADRRAIVRITPTRAYGLLR
ncbi:TIGR03618 family F420-dependent PPOX class oxidoreductase [Nocardia sp. SYP-A9097]|uniref:PPOX class F420-dependent oxidoreductase n=1 Tax=Nocardia sp. SYP-A9097 TaxID=2663237 RepID=UPI00129B763F|nr:PPOX class F420-dependent oxidoreductase [Nocardia sp. SYP-A9097]MRH93461.1 TIGR03618 family F420-dependent PPOX class oxidoreductase [Nocardia sp. SYP-A9097]